MCRIEISNDIFGKVQPLEPLLEALNALFPDEVQRIASAAPRSLMEPFTNTFILHRREGKPWFLKGTPRDAGETELTERLHEIDPEHTVGFLVADLLPGAEWRWVITEWAGEAVIDDNGKFMGIQTVLEAVKTLAQLQIRAATDTLIPRLIPRCEGPGMQELVQEVCAWYAEKDAECAGYYRDASEEISRDMHFFRKLEEPLGDYPRSVVHVDFWGGNIVREGDRLRILDWSQALWGIGGLSVVDLLNQHKDELTKHREEIWSLYAGEIGYANYGVYADACQKANAAVGVLTHQRFLANYDEVSRLRGAAKNTLSELIEAIRSAN
jgi:hypothetical protein